MTYLINVDQVADYLIGGVIVRGILSHWLGYEIEKYLFAPVLRGILKYMIKPFSLICDRFFVSPVLHVLGAGCRWLLRITEQDIAYYHDQKQARRTNSVRGR